MTGRERCEALMEYIVEANQGYFDKERIGNDLTAILIDLGVLELLKPFLKRSLHIEKIDLTKEENKIYKGYLPKDYNKTYIYKWDYNHSIWDMFRNEENAIKLKEWLNNE